MKIGFDHDKYTKMQSERIMQRIDEFGGKLYLELGGKLFDDYHASRVLPGFQPDSKVQMLLQMKDNKDKADLLKEPKMQLDRDLLAMKEPPMRILFLIARQMSQLMAVKDMQQTGTDRGKIASVLKIPPFAARKLIGQAGAYTREEIVLRVQRAVELEEAVKTGSMNDRIAVELMIAGR